MANKRGCDGQMGNLLILNLLLNSTMFNVPIQSPSLQMYNHVEIQHTAYLLQFKSTSLIQICCISALA